MDPWLYRGKLFIPEAYPEENHPFMGSKQWRPGRVRLEGRDFENVLMLYDIELTRLAFNLPLGERSYFTFPHPQRVEEFRIDGKHFVPVETDEGLRFLELVHVGHTPLYFDHQKRRSRSSSGAEEFTYKLERYILMDEALERIGSRKDLQRLFPEHEASIKTYFRQEAFYLRTATRADWVKLLSMINKLEEGGTGE